MELNQTIQVSGTAIEIFGQDKECRIQWYPLQDDIIKINMLYYCCFAHPSLIMRREFFTKLTYTAGPIEDYRLWLSYISNEAVKFANIGSAYLRLRKH